MSESKYLTMRHMETVRNYLDTCCRILTKRGQHHDQSKLESPEVEVFEIYTPKLQVCAYNSDAYQQNLREMKVAIDHHNRNNRHHPEYFENGIHDMNIFDLLEMLVDWKASVMRHPDGNIYRSLEVNQQRFGYSDELKGLLARTIQFIETFKTIHKAHES